MNYQSAGLPIEEMLNVNLGVYYRQRISTHMNDSYAGVRMRKFPEDLRVYESLFWQDRVNVVIEIGSGQGGSALWFRDRLKTLSHYGRSEGTRVISIDIDTTAARQNLAQVDPGYAQTIRLIQGDVRDPSVVDLVRREVPDDSRVLVSEDSAHSYDTTLAALRYFSSFVPHLGYMVIEDGHRDLPNMLPGDMPSKNNGALRALSAWLGSEATGRFVVRRDLERYGVTTNPRGWLQRVR